MGRCLAPEVGPRPYAASWTGDGAEIDKIRFCPSPELAQSAAIAPHREVCYVSASSRCRLSATVPALAFVRNNHAFLRVWTSCAYEYGRFFLPEPLPVFVRSGSFDVAEDALCQ